MTQQTLTEQENSLEPSQNTTTSNTESKATEKSKQSPPPDDEIKDKETTYIAIEGISESKIADDVQEHIRDNITDILLIEGYPVESVEIIPEEFHVIHAKRDA